MDQLAQHEFKIDSAGLKAVKQVKQVGANLRFGCHGKNIIGAKRVELGIQRAKRIRWAPLPLHARGSLLATLVNPASLYGFPACGLPQTLLNSLRSSVTTALWGDGKKLRCREIVLTLLCKGHLVDPVQVIFPDDHIVAVALGRLNFMFSIW